MEVCFYNFILALFYISAFPEKTVNCIYLFFPCNKTPVQLGAYDGFAVKIN